MSRIIVEVADTTDKQADDLAVEIVDYLIHVEGAEVSSYWVEQDA